MKLEAFFGPYPALDVSWLTLGLRGVPVRLRGSEPDWLLLVLLGTLTVCLQHLHVILRAFEELFAVGVNVSARLRHLLEVGKKEIH